MRRLLVVLAVVWAVGFGLYVAFGPVYYSSGEVVDCIPGPCPPGQVAAAAAAGPHTSSGLAANGPYLLFVLGVPVLFAAAPLGVRRAWQRTVAGIAAVLTLAFVVVGAMSVGLFYLPNAAALAMAAVWPAPRGERWERWFSWLVALTGGVGAVWFYSLLRLGDGVWGGPFRALTLTVIVVVFVVGCRDLRRRYAARSATVNR